jgi:AcrR family transcriptional regulator
MAIPFTDAERQRIRTLLLTEGREMFVRYGLKKTSIADLTRAAGIGQGSFYLFFRSKEDLFFEILDHEEKMLREIIADMLSSCEPTRMRIKEVMIQSLTLLSENELIASVLHSDDYERLMNRVPEDKVASHLAEESNYVERELQQLQSKGVFKRVKSEVISGVLYALFILHLHKRQIGEAVFPHVVELLADVICDGLVSQGEGNLTDGSPSYFTEE